MELKYIKGAKKKPVVLKQSAFDVAVKIRALKAQVDEVTKQMPFFKESVLVNEKDRQDLLLATQAQNKNVIDMIITKIFDNYKDLVDGGDMQMERMRMQLLLMRELYLLFLRMEILYLILVFLKNIKKY